MFQYHFVYLFSRKEIIMSPEFDALVYVGRFSPYHFGHHSVVTAALRKSRKVIVLVGSSNAPRSHRTPFTAEERIKMVLDANRNYADRIVAAGIPDYPYDMDRWIASVQSEVAKHVAVGAKIGLIGHNKDESSFYLKLFPQWGSVDVPHADLCRGGPVSGTQIREAYFRPDAGMSYLGMPKTTVDFLIAFRGTQDYRAIVEESRFVKDYLEQWKETPYPVIFQTVDAVVIQAGHVLLVKRGAHPGKGKGALPGGYVNRFETLQDAAIRELKEETRIDVPDAVLRSAIVTSETFDDPWRDPRGRVITTAFLFDLDGELTSRVKRKGVHHGLAKVKGSDDAEKARWIPLSELDPMKMYSDHLAIIQKMLGRK